MTRALILGVGNTVRCDDGVGVAVVRRLARTDTPGNVDVADAGTSGLGMLDMVSGYDRLVIVDAIDCGEPPGTILRLSLDDLRRTATLNSSNPHQSDLATILETGRRLGLAMPREVDIVAIQIQDATTFSERCSAPVEAAIDRACTVAIECAVSG